MSNKRKRKDEIYAKETARKRGKRRSERDIMDENFRHRDWLTASK